MQRGKITLIGDGIENPGNAETMVDAAAMFGSQCRFRDRYGLAARWQAALEGSTSEPQEEWAGRFITYGDLSQDFSPIVAFDNIEGAQDVYGFQLPAAVRPAVVMGNERQGIARDIQALASHRVQIPMFAQGSRTINCLNVASASAVALYYMAYRGGGSGKLQVSSHPNKRRPELMLVGGHSHIELGSSIRSAGAFGWERVLLEDRMQVWFRAHRSVMAEGRSAARRHRNPIRLIPSDGTIRYAFQEVCIVTTRRDVEAIPLHRANLARGPQQLLVIPDESSIDVTDEDWQRFGKRPQFVHIDVPAEEFVYHYRLLASIALAEATRQVGQRARATARARRQEPFYDSALALVFENMGETVYLDELELY